MDYGDRREKVLAKQACVFMLRGIFKNWKYVLSYYVSGSGVHGKDLADMLINNVKMALHLGLNVRAVVCDQGKLNLY